MSVVARRYPPAELTEIVFGMNIPYAQQATLRQVVAGPEWEHVQFQKVVSADRFEVEIVAAT